MTGALLRNLVAALMACALPMGDNPSEGEVLYTLKGYPVVVRYEAGEAVHAGVDIFGERPEDRTLCRLMDFVERYSLQMLLLDTDADRQLQMRLDGVSMPSFFETALHRDGPVRFELEHADQRKYTLRWGHEGEGFREMTFVSDYQLISGLNKIELENGFIPALIAEPEDLSILAVAPDPKALRRIGRNLYRDFGGSYLIDAISHTTYFQKEKGEYLPVLSEDHPMESLFNLFELPVCSEGPWNLSMRVLKYGYQVETVEIPVRRFVNYCLAEGCTPYLGLESYDPDSGEIIATLMMHNEMLSYDHVAKITANRSRFAEGGGTIAMTVSVFLPIHNIKNLFDE